MVRRVVQGILKIFIKVFVKEISHFLAIPSFPSNEPVEGPPIPFLGITFIVRYVLYYFHD